MKMSMVSLGCDKNTVDSEMMLGLMNEKGFEYTDIDDYQYLRLYTVRKRRKY